MSEPRHTTQMCMTPGCGARVATVNASLCPICTGARRVEQGLQCDECGRPIVNRYCPDCRAEDVHPTFALIQFNEHGRSSL